MVIKKYITTDNVLDLVYCNIDYVLRNCKPKPKMEEMLHLIEKDNFILINDYNLH